MTMTLYLVSLFLAGTALLGCGSASACDPYSRVSGVFSAFLMLVGSALTNVVLRAFLGARNMNGDETLLHYAPQPIVAIEPRVYSHDFFKPCGFWVSVGDSWKEWCEGEEFNQDRLLVCHRVELQPDANILRLTTASDIDRFTTEFLNADARIRLEAINWPKVAEHFQGLLIAPYCWQRRMSEHTMWYYGWDCASGCIWDVAAIQSVTVIEPDHISQLGKMVSPESSRF